MAYRRLKGDIHWYLHKSKRKTPIAYSTTATSDFLVTVHQDNPTFTINQLYALLTDHTKFIYNPEAITVLEAYIKYKEGDIVPLWR